MARVCGRSSSRVNVPSNSLQPLKHGLSILPPAAAALLIVSGYQLFPPTAAGLPSHSCSAGRFGQLLTHKVIFDQKRHLICLP